MGTCEHIALSSCDDVPGYDVRVTVDFLTESMENGAVGLLVNDLRYVSREDGTYDDGGQTPISSDSTQREYLSGLNRVVVEFGNGVTNITYNFLNFDTTDRGYIAIRVVHSYGKWTIPPSVQTVHYYY